MINFKKIFNCFKRYKALDENIYKAEVAIPIRHFVQLKKLAEAREENCLSTINFLLKRNFSSEQNWIDEDSRFAHLEKTDKKIIEIESNSEDTLANLKDVQSILKAIQAIPIGIRPKTDGAQKNIKTSFFVQNGVQGIDINGMRFLDPSNIGAREVQMYEFVKDKFENSITLPQYRIYTFANSQYLRLTEEPLLFTMPVRKQIACDAGAYVGYKAIAMAKLVGPEGHVIAYEVDEQNFQFLKRNIELNNLQDRVTPVMGALSDKVEDLVLYTQAQGTMAHSLTKFESAGNSTAPSIKNPTQRTVTTVLLGEDLKRRGFEKIDSLHVSVNGYEAEVLYGLGDLSSKIGVYRVVSIFKKDGVLVSDKVKNYYLENKILFAGRSGGSLIAGPLSPFYHINEHKYEWLKND